MNASPEDNRTSRYGSKNAYSDPLVYATYDQKRFTSYGGKLFDRREKAILLAGAPADAESRILECGAGTGRFAAEMARRGYRVLATDVSPGMLDQTRKRVEMEGLSDRVSVEYGDIYNLKFPDGTFDFVYSLRVLNQLADNQDKRRAITELARVVRPGGWLLFDVVNLHSLAILKNASWHISPRAVRRILEDAGCRIERLQGAMLLTQTLIEVVPRPLAWLANMVDRGACRLLPFLATRVYFLARKLPPTEQAGDT
jgi:ubiquinone/menaquinone biosynthesis C-methylase UbiE